MYHKVLVGIDEGDGGRDAIALAQELSGTDATIVLAYVHGGYPLIGRGASAPFEALECERAQGILDNARSESGIAAETRAIGSPTIGRGLHVLAEREGADLLIVGSTRRSLMGRVMIGDDTRSSLNGAPCAVAIAPAGYAAHPNALREIGVAYDGSPESEHALGVARAFASEHGAKLSLFRAVEIPTYAFMGGPVPIDGLIDTMLEDVRSSLAAIEDAEPHVVYGQPAEELALYSASVDVLVIGSRGYGPIGRLVYGSTTRQLMRTARCPLLVLTKASRDTDAMTSEITDSATVGSGA